MLITAVIFTFLLGIIHSILGELLIFKKLRHRAIVPTNGGELLAARQVRILWASWHLVTLFGWCLAIILWYLADVNITSSVVYMSLVNAISITMFCGAFLVLFATKGKHPGWVVLTLIGVLTFLL